MNLSLLRQWLTFLNPTPSNEDDNNIKNNFEPSCRFLQGAETLDEDKQRISDAIKAEKDCSVNLLNYKKDGTKFINEVSILCLQMQERRFVWGVISG